MGHDRIISCRDKMDKVWSYGKGVAFLIFGNWPLCVKGGGIFWDTKETTREKRMMGTAFQQKNTNQKSHFRLYFALHLDRGQKCCLRIKWKIQCRLLLRFWVWGWNHHTYSCFDDLKNRRQGTINSWWLAKSKFCDIYWITTLRLLLPLGFLEN